MSTISPKIYAVYYGQDDPKKNTILKLKKFNLIKIVKQLKFVPRNAIILDPFSEKVLNFSDRGIIEKYGLVVIDCSWEKVDLVFKNKFKTGRKLPPLLAANSVNYGKWNKLSSAEAIIGALLITGFQQEAESLISKFNWGETFIRINENLLMNNS